MRVELRDEATEDLVDGATFYGEQSTGLDEHFLECLRSDLHLLETTARFTKHIAAFIARFRNGSPSRSIT